MPVLIAARDPFGMFVDGAFKSPLMFIPDSIPVTVGKNTPKTMNQLLSALKFGNMFSFKLFESQPSNPCSKK